MSESLPPMPPAEPAPATTAAAVGRRDRRDRRSWLLLLLLLLLLLFCCLCLLFTQYLLRPAPLPELLPVPVNYAPHYLFSIYGVDKPLGIALSPQGDRLYVTEAEGQRLVRIFDRDGNPLGSFAPPGTTAAERAPVYAAVDAANRVFVTDRLQHAVFVFDRQGQYEDTLLGPYLTLSEYVAKHAGGLEAGTVFTYNVFADAVRYTPPLSTEQALPGPGLEKWAPLGLMFDHDGNLMITDVESNGDSVRTLAAEYVQAPTWANFNPMWVQFGTTGEGNGEFMFPNDVVLDSRGRAYITDGNNGRISVWSKTRTFLLNFGKGSGDGSLNLPRGADMDDRDRLHVVDAVGQGVRVYDVSGEAPIYLFTFGEMGLGDGQFNYPNDIVLDATGRLYITDRENNRIQVWSY